MATTYQELILEVKKVFFGDTGYLVNPLGLGLAALGRPGYINLGHGIDLNFDYDLNRMQENAHKMFDFAVKSNICFFDAAQSYGKAEDFLSSWLRLRQFNKSDVFVSTKWGYTYTALWKVNAPQHEVKEHSLVVLNRQWNLSKKRLMPWLKLHQIHSATIESGVLENFKVLDRLAAIKDSGQLIGLSVSGPNQSEIIDASLKIQVEGRRLFDSLQVTYNLLESSAHMSIHKAIDLGLGIIVKEPLANGLLTSKNTDYKWQSMVSSLQQMATNHRVGIDAIALAYARQKSHCHVILSGASTVQQLQENILSRTISLSEKELKTLDNHQILPTNYWKSRSKMVWN